MPWTPYFIESLVARLFLDLIIFECCLTTPKANVPELIVVFIELRDKLNAQSRIVLQELRNKIRSKANGRASKQTNPVDKLLIKAYYLQLIPRYFPCQEWDNQTVKNPDW